MNATDENFSDDDLQLVWENNLRMLALRSSISALNMQSKNPKISRYPFFTSSRAARRFS